MLLKLLSAISRDLISDRRTARTTTFRLVLLSAISRDLISDGAMIILAVAAHEVTIRYFAGPDLRRMAVALIIASFGVTIRYFAGPDLRRHGTDVGTA